MFRIAKTFEFQSAHQLADLPEGHKCARLHGHSYASEIVLASQMLQPPGSCWTSLTWPRWRHG